MLEIIIDPEVVLAGPLAAQLAKIDTAHQALNNARSAVAQCWEEDPSQLDILHQAVLRANDDGERERMVLVDVVRKALYGSGLSLGVAEKRSSPDPATVTEFIPEESSHAAL
jgi:hypothetical protein